MLNCNVEEDIGFGRKKSQQKKFFENCGQAKEKCEIRDIIDRISNAGESEKIRVPRTTRKPKEGKNER